MKNCRSRSLSPVSDQDRSRSVSPVPAITPSQLSASISNISVSNSAQVQKSFISVAPTSKLMSRTMQESAVRQLSNRSAKKKRSSSRIPTPNTSNSNNNNNHNLNTISVTQILSNNNNNSNTALNNNFNNNNSLNNNKSCTITRAQDLRTNIAQFQTPQPPPPPMLHAPPLMHENMRHNFPHHFLPPPPNLFPLRPPFFPRPPRFNLPPTSSPPEPPRLPPIRAPPPVTILVPYPIILPLPIPIPIPLPLIDFIKAAQLSADAAKMSSTAGATSAATTNISTDTAETSQGSATIQPNSPANVQFDSELPLDFTTSRNMSSPQSSNSMSISQKQKQLPHHVITEVQDNLNVINMSKATDDGDEEETQEQRLPKFKITRLNSRRFLTKESECTRPLRKRKRIILAEDVDPDGDDSRN